MLADHADRVKYELPLPPAPAEQRNSKTQARGLYVHAPRGRHGRAIDDRTEEFVEARRVGAGA